jgi:hypothetical protein
MVEKDADVADYLSALERRLGDRFDAVQRPIDALDRRVEHAWRGARQAGEDLMLVKAMSCQLRGRVERVERRASRSVG